ncbi:hypothetical protein RBB50_011795 [Rhinocladiella similis]
MPPSELDDFDSLVLQPFKLNHEVRLPKYAGGGMAGHVFKIHMNKKGYAPKMFKFDNPSLNASRFKGTERKAFHDPFYIECPANGALSNEASTAKSPPSITVGSMYPTR